MPSFTFVAFVIARYYHIRRYRRVRYLYNFDILLLFAQDFTYNLHHFLLQIISELSFFHSFYYQAKCNGSLCLKQTPLMLYFTCLLLCELLRPSKLLHYKSYYNEKENTLSKHCFRSWLQHQSNNVFLQSLMDIKCQNKRANLTIYVNYLSYCLY